MEVLLGNRMVAGVPPSTRTKMRLLPLSSTNVALTVEVPVKLATMPVPGQAVLGFIGSDRSHLPKYWMRESVGGTALPAAQTATAPNTTAQSAARKTSPFFVAEVRGERCAAVWLLIGVLCLGGAALPNGAHRALEDAIERPGVFHIDHTAIIIVS